MTGFRNVSKSNPCPICGKPDWCSTQYVENGEMLHYCRRVLSGINVTSAVNGMRYVFIKQTKDGSCLYKEESAYLTSRKEWLDRTAGHKSGHMNNCPPRHPISGPTPCSKPDIKEIQPLGNPELDRIYRSLLHKLSLRKDHIRYLKRERWPNDLITRSLVRSMPYAETGKNKSVTRERITKELLQEFGSLKGVPGFYEKQNGQWTFAGSSGLLIPLYDTGQHVYRLRLRLDHPETDENGKEKNKYHNFSSYYEVEAKKGVYTNAFTNGCRSGSHIGLYADRKKDDYCVCYITEGEKKSIFANHILHNPIISIPGVNSFGKIFEPTGNGYTILDYLAAKGCTTIIIAYDSDKYVNKAVLMYEQKLLEQLSKYNFRIALAYWNPGFGKGLDDILSINVRPNYELVKE